MNTKILKSNFKAIIKELKSVKDSQLEKHPFGAYVFSYKNNSFFKEREHVISMGTDSYLNSFVKHIGSGNQNILLFSNENVDVKNKKVINWNGVFDPIETFYFFYDKVMYYRNLRLSINSLTFNSIKSTLKDDRNILVTPGLTMEELEEKFLDLEKYFRNKIEEENKRFIQLILNIDYNYTIKCVSDFLVGYIAQYLIHHKLTNILHVFSSEVTDGVLNVEQLIERVKNQENNDFALRLMNPLLAIYDKNKKEINETFELFYTNLLFLFSHSYIKIIENVVQGNNVMLQINQGNDNKWATYSCSLLGYVLKYINQNFYFILDNLDKIEKIPNLTYTISTWPNVCYFIKINNLQNFYNVYGMEGDAILSKCSIKEISNNSCDDCKKYFSKAIQGKIERKKVNNLFSKAFAVRESKELKSTDNEIFDYKKEGFDFENQNYMYVNGLLIELPL